MRSAPLSSRDCSPASSPNIATATPSQEYVDMLFYHEIWDIRRNADAIALSMGPLERIQWDRADMRRCDLRRSAQELRDAAGRCEAIADRFDEPALIEQLEAAE